MAFQLCFGCGVPAVVFVGCVFGCGVILVALFCRCFGFVFHLYNGGVFVAVFC